MSGTDFGFALKVVLSGFQSIVESQSHLLCFALLRSMIGWQNSRHFLTEGEGGGGGIFLRLPFGFM